MAEVSIIIPNYNGANFIKECIDSLKAQEYKDFEIIMVDNDSRDWSVEIVERDFPEVRIKKP